ncbi:MAG: bifunctional 5,10-methylenetetrahydrofolate dehydrogenase/5,10-methenyltetrahydrofolate cyclohydrolase [Elusimicrobia bacterium]|nr:bifunctional 5,10-methylenetetrahydrofolate dehydrogenase/5,10-methenyltetrahydrofolate cyclohydrolase [Elusimicrobiota bacterium]
MSAAVLDGSALARKIRQELAPRAAALAKKLGRKPALAIVSSARPDRATLSYRQSQKKACEEVGIWWETLARDWKSADEILAALKDGKPFEGAILDLPLNDGVDVERLLARLPPESDVEGVTPFNFGRLFEIKAYAEIQRRRLVAPCTALAVAELLRETRAPLSGKNAVVLGRSNIVGKPAAHLLSCLDLTVTLCHSKTRDLAELVKRADVVVAAMGKPKSVRASWIKPGAIVIDAGVSEEDGALCGDVEAGAAEKAGWLTPTVGGVGPVTTAMLLSNSVLLAERKAR